MDYVIINEKKYVREFVSFGGVCPYKCKHCYTFIPGYKYDVESDIDLLVQPLKTKSHIDIVYVSGHRENFVNPDDGILLCEKIYSIHPCDILFTTRNHFSPSQIDRLSRLNATMQKNGYNLFACVSIPALYSYSKIENPSFVPTPEERMLTLKALYDRNIYTLLTIRPLFHEKFIPVSEPIEIIKRCSSFSSAVLCSGLVTNEHISRSLNYPAGQKMKEKKELMKCLNQQNIVVEYCDVSEELFTIGNFCLNNGIPLFSEVTNPTATSISLAAIDYLKRKST